MGKTVETKTPPKRFAHKLEINVADTGSTVAEIVEWCRDHLRGTVHWMAVGFGQGSFQSTHWRTGAVSKAFRVAPSRKKHFEDETHQLTVWFSLKTDAAIYKLTWG